MPRDASGNYTLPAGNPVVDGTIIDVTWANPTMNDIAVQLNNVLTRDGLLGPIAPLYFVDGTVGAPGMGFSSEHDLGMYRISLGVGGLSADGAKVVQWSSVGFGVVGALQLELDAGPLGNVLELFGPTNVLIHGGSGSIAEQSFYAAGTEHLRLSDVAFQVLDVHILFTPSTGSVYAWNATVPSGESVGFRLGQTGVQNWDFINAATSGELQISNGAGMEGLKIDAVGAVRAPHILIAGDGTTAGDIMVIQGKHTTETWDTRFGADAGDNPNIVYMGTSWSTGAGRFDIRVGGSGTGQVMESFHVPSKSIISSCPQAGAISPTVDNTMSWSQISNTVLRVEVKCNDGTVRHADLAIAP